MEVKQILVDAVKKEASDIFIISGACLAYKIDNRVVPQEGATFMPSDTKAAVYEIFDLAGIDIGSPDDLKSEMDFSFSIAGTGRFRANIYRQRGSFSAVLRCVPFELPDSQKLGIPESVMSLADTKSGIVLVTGAAGNGKSTTLSCIIDRINSNSEGHIITIEDPIEFLHKHKKCIISQREINIDTDSYVNALRAALRQAPNVILVGEMRDFETINIAMTAAETGQLVLSTLHT
ncbi:MAG: Flp pilus assembly complex ATPase component TadA, partial [Oscillospiraceae bacterium]|nr:Flp pilus assembly complex ATPase component TadA [Oscillospiraceae bacterium]